MSSPSSLPRPVTCGAVSDAEAQERKSSPFALDLSRIRDISAPRKASIRDVNGMSALINEFAARGIMLARGPLYLYQSIQDYRVMTMPASDGTERVVACGGLHVLWEDLAEVRSVAVHPALQKTGSGGLWWKPCSKTPDDLMCSGLLPLRWPKAFSAVLNFPSFPGNSSLP